MTSMVLHDAPLQAVHGQDTTERIRALNRLLLGMAIDQSRTPESGGRMALTDQERKGFLSLTPVSSARWLDPCPILVFQPTPMLMAETIAIRPSVNEKELEACRRWLRLAHDLVTDTTQLAAWQLAAVSHSEARDWRSVCTDERCELIARTGAIEWMWRFPMPPSDSWGASEQAGREVVPELITLVAWSECKSRFPGEFA